MEISAWIYSWVQSGGPVTTESIVRFDTWFQLFEVFRKNLAPMTLVKMAAEFVRKPKSKMAAGGYIGNVTWKQIDIESCVIPLFLLILAWRIPIWHRFCILTSPTIKIQDGRLRPYWKCNVQANGHRNPCIITSPTKYGIESPFLASFLYFDESTYINSRWPPSTNSICFCFKPYNAYHLLNFTREIRFQQYVFTSWYYFLYFDEPKHQNSRWPPAAILKI